MNCVLRSAGSAPPAVCQHGGIGELVLVERMRQRHQDRRAGRSPPAPRPSRRRSARPRDGRRRCAPAGRRRTARPRRRRRAAHRSSRTRVDVLLARLLHDREPRAQRRVELLDRGRHDVGHDARALAAAEHQEPQRRRRLGRRDRASRRPRSPPGRTGLPVCVALAASAASRVEHAGKAGRDRGRRAAPAAGWRGPSPRSARG